MDTKKTNNNLQKSSGLFLQLGLVLTLFTVYALFEYKTAYNEVMVINKVLDEKESDIYVDIPVFQIEKKVIKAKTAQKILKQKFVEEFIQDDDPKIIENLLPIITSDPDEEPIVIGDSFVPVETIDEPDTVPFIAIEDAPIFPGCEKVSEEEKKACFSKKMTHFISRKFNADLANQLGLSSGRKRIYVQFVITSKGDIIIEGAKGPHVRLEKEGKRVVDLLPKMIPGMQRGVPVNVKYMLPITFEVE